jgi:hypothetical protein
MSSAYAPSKDEVAGRWQKKMAEFDAYIFTAAEYNRGPTAVLKNALDYLQGMGQQAGRTAMAVWRRRRRQLRLNAIELQMAPPERSPHTVSAYLAVVKEERNSATSTPIRT